MLNPFRIRNLYFNSSDVFDCSGLVQLSLQQYDEEIKSTPEAVLAYLDEDDGEIVTVGSSFELEQRLLEPPGRFSSWNGQLATDNPPPPHVFDMQRSSHVADVWRKYVIPYTQPVAPNLPPNLAPESSLQLQARKQDDYQSLMARIQVLELEVKLLREAFKMHKNMTSVQPQAPQRSVFSNAVQNSDLCAQESDCSMHPTVVDKQNPRDQHKSPDFGTASDFGYHRVPVPGEPTALNNGRVYCSGSIQSTTSKETAHERDNFPETSKPVAERLTNHPLTYASEETNEKGQMRDRLGSSVQEMLRKSEGSRAPDLEGRVFSKEAIENKKASAQNISELELKYDPSTSTLSAAVPSPTPQQGFSKSLMDLEPEAEIARFPTIFQLEKENLQSLREKRTNQEASVSASGSLARASTVNENVQALGDRMIAQEASINSTGSLARANTVNKNLQALKDRMNAMNAREASVTSNLQALRDRTVAQEASSSSTKPLARANTVTGSNPAARLLKPFDPAAEDPTSQSPLPRRSGTVRYRRRPYAEQFSGAGRTLWEEFERSGPKAQDEPIHETTDATSSWFRKPRARPLDDPPSYQDYSPFTRSHSLNQPDHPRSHRLPPMRSVIDLAGTSRTHQSWNEHNSSGYRPAAANSTPNLVQPSPPESHNKRPRKVESCIDTLQEMGYKPKDMLPIYAEACNGNVVDAVTMAEEDQKATRETIKSLTTMRKVHSCFLQLKVMGYGAQYRDDELRRFAKNVDGDVTAAVEKIETKKSAQRDSERMEMRVRSQGIGVGMGMPGSFP